jgi:hypothetical protein
MVEARVWCSDWKTWASRALYALLAQVILSNLGLNDRFEELGSLPSRPLNLGLKAA